MSKSSVLRLRTGLSFAVLLSTASPVWAQGGINLAAEGTELVWRGPEAGARAGMRLDQGAVGSGDDRRDLIIGAPGGEATVGRVYVIFGGPVNSGTLSLASANVVFNGPAVGDLFGTATAAGNIVTLDGSAQRDLAIGAPGAMDGRGAVYVYRGGVSHGASIDTASAVLRIIGATGDQLGSSLATADLDGDGYREVIIGAPGNSRVYVIRGGSSLSGEIDLSTTPAASVISGPGIGAILMAGDTTGDGSYDIFISAPYEDGSRGRVYMLNGRPGGFPSSVTLPAQASAQFSGVNPGDLAGMGLRVADFDGDGRPDVIIGAPGADPQGRLDAGAVYIIWGSDSIGSRSLASADIVIFGEQAGHQAGMAIEAGDINRDTPNDLAILASGARGGTGEIHVVYGSSRSRLGSIIDLANGMARRLYAEPSDGPITAAAVFEVTGEGARDVIVAVPSATTPDGAQAGQVYVSISPKLVLASSSAAMRAAQGSTGRTQIQVFNSGVGVITWSAASSAPWLQPMPANGEASASNPGLLTIATATTLGPGTHTGSIVVTSTSPHLVMSKTLTVTLTVRPCAVGGRAHLDFDGDSCADLAVFRPASGDWFIEDVGVVKWGLPTDVPVPGDYNGNGKTDVAVYRPSTGQWFIHGQGMIQYGLPGDVPVPADYDGDGRLDIAVYRPSNRTWYVKDHFVIKWGAPNDTPVPGDYDGDGRADVAVYRRSTGMWYVRDVITVKWGGPGYVPVPADYNGDGRTDITVVGADSGTWYVKDLFTITWGTAGDRFMALDRDGDGAAEMVAYRPTSNQWHIRNVMRRTTSVEVWGGPGDVPAVQPAVHLSSVASDADGDRAADLLVWRPDTGDWWITYRASGFSTWDRYKWGFPTDTPVAADYDGDGRVDPAVFRASTGYWYVLQSTTGYTGWAPPFSFGGPGDIPVPGDYVGRAAAQVAYWRPSTGAWVIAGGPTATIGASGDIPAPADYDGDGRTDMAVFRPSTGQWLIRTSSSGFAALVTTSFGANGDVPTPADFDGDGKADLAFYRPSAGTWHILHSATGSVHTVAWGLSTDVPVPGDFNGDGLADIAVWRPETGMWFVRGQYTFRWGMEGDLPALKR